MSLFPEKDCEKCKMHQEEIEWLRNALMLFQSNSVSNISTTPNQIYGPASFTKKEALPAVPDVGKYMKFLDEEVEERKL